MSLTPGTAGAPADFSKKPAVSRLVLLVTALLLLGFVALYCTAVSPYWKISPDTTTYVLAAQSLAEGRGYTEGGQPAMLFPPGTSALLALGWIAGRGSFQVMNAEVMLFTFASLAVCFLLFRQPLGTVGACAVVLLCLASTEFFKASTQLLSEMFYLFWSLLALLFYQRGGTARTVVCALATVMMRSAGVSLAAALFLDSLGQRPRRWTRIAALTAPLWLAALWEFRNRRQGWSYTKIMMQSEPWVSSSPNLSVVGLLARLSEIVGYGRLLERQLTNQDGDNGFMALSAGIILGAFFLAGCWRFVTGGRSSLVLYMVLSVAVVSLSWPFVESRLVMPLLPLVFGSVIAGIRWVAEKTRPLPVYAAAAVFVTIFLGTGFRAEFAAAARERSSPFSETELKYPANYDLQRVALWWKQTAAAEDGYACRQPNVIAALTGRAGSHYELTNDPKLLVDDLDAKHAKYLFLDLNIDRDRQLAGVLAQSDQFRLVKQEPRAQLYHVAE
jgi:hypothetical protein